MLAVLNEQRQILAINDSFLKFLGIEDPQKSLGLRYGEAVECIHSHDEEGGCGTSKYCPTCGAAIAVVTAIDKGKPEERLCALTVNKSGKESDIALLVKAHPIVIEDHKFILLFLQDITREEQRAALERTFYHDINNLLQGLVGQSKLLTMQSDGETAKKLHDNSMRLYREVAIQSCLSKQDPSSYNPMYFEIPVFQVMDELVASFDQHPAAKNKKIILDKNIPDLSVKTDISLLLRVLCNMVTNALEATGPKEEIKISVKQEDGNVVFQVWNKKAILKSVQLRIFQRNFSTKSGAGRGIGTFSMKLFGEQILRGKVAFTSDEENGTTFRLSLPL